MSTAQLIEMAKHNIVNAKAGKAEGVDSVMKVPAEHYFEEARWKLEMDKVFRRIPLMLATTAELKNPGDYKAMEAAGVPVIISRGSDGEVRAFVNSCAHRGAQIMMEGTGNTKKFVCPYHAWSFNQKGDLVAVLRSEEFGEIDKSCYGLKVLPSLEKAGLIWVTLSPNSTLDINTFLSGYDAMLDHFGFEHWFHFESRTLRGPNWKIAYDGYLDLYHLPILHKDTFGGDFPNQTLYYEWGPHQRVTSPDKSMVELEKRPESDWPLEPLMSGVWTIFPHISIASFDGGGGRGVMLSQLFPGETPQESFTVQNYLLEKEPTNEQAAAAHEQFKFLEYVVLEEDYATGLRQQKSLMTGARDHVLFGQNEGGGQRFHQWVDKLINTRDEDLNAVFANAGGTYSQAAE